MIEPIAARLEAARLDNLQRELRLREEGAIAGFGEKTLGQGNRSGRLASLAAEATTVRGQLLALKGARGTSPAGPRQRIEMLEKKLRQIHLTAGRLALAMPPTGAESEVLAIRAEMAAVATERDRLRGEGQRLVEESWSRLRSWATPRAPALIAMVLGWWIARSYAVSHTATILTSLGFSIKRRGPHLLSLTTDTFIVQYGLPVVVAVVCAFLAHRLDGPVRTAIDTIRERSGGTTPTPASPAPPRGA